MDVLIVLAEWLNRHGKSPDIARSLPESVRSMIQRKIDGLEEDDRRLLLTASVQGYEFDAAVAVRYFSGHRL